MTRFLYKNKKVSPMDFLLLTADFLKFVLKILIILVYFLINHFLIKRKACIAKLNGTLFNTCIQIEHFPSLRPPFKWIMFSLIANPVWEFLGEMIFKETTGDIRKCKYCVPTKLGKWLHGILVQFHWLNNFHKKTSLGEKFKVTYRRKISYEFYL